MLFRSRTTLLALTCLAGLLLGSPWRTAGADDRSLNRAGAPRDGDRDERGARTIYRIEYRSASETSFSRVLSGSGSRSARPAPGLDNTFLSRVRGTFSFVVLARDPDGDVLVFRMESGEVSLGSNGSEDPEQALEARAALGQTCLVKRARSGKIVSVWIGPKLNETAQTFVRALVAGTQVSVPEDVGPRRSWESEEEDPTGRYVARYEVTSRAHGSEERGRATAIRKTKVRYLQEPEPRHGTSIAPLPSVEVSGSMAGQLDMPSRTLLSLSGEESQRFLLNGRSVAKARNRLSISLLERARADDAELRLLGTEAAWLQRSVAPTSLFVPPSREASEAAVEQSELGTATAEELLAALRAAETDTPPDGRPAARTNLYLKLKALAHLHPESCPVLGAELARAKPGSIAFEVLPLALSKAGSAEAQAALVSVIRQRAREPNMVKVLVTALANVGAITPATEEALSDLAYRGKDPELASRARLVLGAQARALTTASPERAGAIVNGLLRAFEGATPDERAVLLLALGNAGSPHGFPAIRRGASDDAPNVRVSAVAALRLFDTSEAEALLLHSLESDPDEFVRSQAAAALGSRKMTPASADAHRRVFASEAPELVRIAVVQNLWNARSEYPDLRRLVQLAAAKDRSNEVRKEAGRLLAGSGHGSRSPNSRSGKR